MNRVLISIVIIFAFSSFVFSQGNNCGNTEPVPICPTDTVLCIYELSDPVIVSDSSNLPNMEFAVVDLGQMATNGSGPAIIHVSRSSRFRPIDIGIDSITSLQIFPIAYDLAAIQETMDDLLKGTFLPPLNLPCCDFASDICDQLMGAGINCGSDLDSLAQAFALFNADTNVLLSVQDFIDGVDSVNMQLADPIVPASCGGGDEICYAYGSACEFSVRLLEPLIAFAAPAHVSDTVAVADNIQSSAIVNSGLFVEYLFGVEVLLSNGFETLGNSEFIADPSACD